ncbi:ABC transporter ATP-binding protein [Ligilactobacillus sp. WILCCON 0076]|uniref:ABC transporter ATP-binding protein n=1 Tax=Ligilactobacillus ubinensis TaxID=2876789 RepID=A0A9X2FKV0_9LACO|nr:ABC transporter ATP-binding protein [Ligilactobacillus ubinensis]MCP0887557.1 ABC transporter ATP-binding protein [Ligilactobacillus ubinensis]
MILLRKVSKIYDRVSLLENINLEIPQGSFCSISGKSGAGKTTLLKIIAGMDAPSSGQVILDGSDLRKYKYPELWGKRFSFVFQNYFLLDDKTVKSNLKIAQKKISEDAMIAALASVGLRSELLYQPVYRLSGGEKQRVGIARATIKPFDVLIADEPTGNLDHQNSQAVIKIFQNLQAMGKTIIVVSHDDDFQKVANQKLYLKDSKLISVNEK